MLFSSIYYFITKTNYSLQILADYPLYASVGVPPSTGSSEFLGFVNQAQNCTLRRTNLITLDSKDEENFIAS